MKLCLKCSYERTLSDPPPVSECPKCGAVYAKLEALAASGERIRPTLVSRTDSLPFEDSRAREPVPDTLSKPEPVFPLPPVTPKNHEPLEGPESQPMWAAPSSSSWHSNETFVQRMRTESLYGAFRAVNSLVFGLLVLVGVIVGASGLFAVLAGTVAVGLGGIVGGFLIIVVALAGKQMSLMVADLSDAAVRLADRADRLDRTNNRRD